MRITPRDSKLVDFKDSAMLTGEELNKAIDQVFYTQQELDETVIASFTEYGEIIESKVIEVSDHAAKASEDNALVSETNAKASELAAKASEDNALVSETNAKASEVAAKASELAAKASEDNALVSETNAKASELAAKASEDNALIYANSVNPELLQHKAEKDQPGGYAGLDATGKIPGDLLNIADPVWGSISGTLSDQTDLQAALDGKANASHSHNYAPASHSHNYAPIPTSSNLPVGVMCMCMYSVPGSGSGYNDIPNGGTVAGSLLYIVCPLPSGAAYGGQLTGTWKNIFGATVEKPGNNKNSGLFVRIA
jgi:hypothetical protein